MASYKKVLIQGDNISHLSNDSNYSTFSGSYNDLSNKPSIPTHTSHLTNNSGFLTSHQSLSGYMPLSGTAFTGDVSLGTSNVTNKITLGTASWKNWYRLNKYWTEFSNNANEGFKFISGGTESYVQFQINNRNQSGGNGVSSVTAYGSIYMNQNKKVATEEFVTGKGYLTSHQSLSGYATQSWVNSQGFLKSETDSQTLSISGKSLSISGGNSVTLPFFDGNYNSLSNKPSIPSLSGYATQSWVNSQGFLTSQTDSQQLSISGSTLSISGGNSISLPTYSTFSGSYNDLSNKPSIPTHTSHLTNNSGYITSTQNISGMSRYNEIRDTRSGDITPNDHVSHRMMTGFTAAIPGSGVPGSLSGNWMSYIHMKGWSDGYASWELIGGSTTSVYEDLYVRFGKSTTWNSAKRIWHSGDFNSGNVSNWNEAYGWGNHAGKYLTSHQSLSGYATQSWVNSQGFLKSQTDSQTLSISGKSLSISSGNSVTLPFFDGNYNSLSNKPSIPSLSGYATQSWVNSQGFLKSDSDTQDLSISGRTISLTNGGSVTVPETDISGKVSLSGGSQTITGNITVGTSTGRGTITALGGNSGYVNGAFVTDSANSHRGGGLFMFDRGSDNEWFIGRPYSGNDSIIISRNSTTYHTGETAQKTKALTTISNSGWITASGFYINSAANSTNWSTAYTHSQSAHAPSNADATPSWVPSSDPGYLTSHQSLSGYATQSWVNSQGFLKSQTDSQTLSISGKSLTISSGNSVTLPFFDGNYNSLSNKPSIPSLSGYATQSWVNSQGFGTSSFSGSYNDLSNKPTIPSATGNAYNVNSQTITPTKVQIQSGDRRDKISLWGGSTYGMGMTSGCTLGAMNDYAMTFQMNNDTDRGFWWGHSQDAVSSGAMSLTTDGQLYVAKQIQVGRGRSHTSALNSSKAMEVYGNMEIVSGNLYIGGSGYNKADFDKGITAHGWGDHSGLYLGATAKAADSDKLDGLDLHTGRNSDANKVVRTDGNGYIQAGWINTPSGATTSTIDRIYASNDGYIRYVTKAEFGKQMSSYIDYSQLSGKPTIPTNNNQLTNGAGYLTSHQSLSAYAPLTSPVFAGTVKTISSTPFAWNHGSWSTSYGSKILMSDSGNGGILSTLQMQVGNGSWNSVVTFGNGVNGSNHIVMHQPTNFNSNIYFNGNRTLGTIGQSDSITINPDAYLYLGTNATDHTYIGASTRPVTINGVATFNQSTSGISYNDLSNKPSIPSAVTNNNQLTNGAGYITSHGIGSTTNLACNALTTSGNLVVNGTTTMKANLTVNATLQVNGNVGYTGTLKRNSDLRLKKDIKPIEKPLEKLSKIRGVDFTWKNNDTKSGGVIAQEVERAMPDYVHDLDTGYKTVDYDALIGVLIESVKELKQKVDNCNCNCKGE